MVSVAPKPPLPARKSSLHEIMGPQTASTPREEAPATSRPGAASIAWRLDPEESFSDWRIEITRKKTKQVDVYHVHRTHLAWGPQHSSYFKALFRNGEKLAEKDGSVSRINLLDEAAEAFPVFLDFLYTGELSCDDNVMMVSLYHLARYFGNSSLESIALTVFMEKFTTSNLQQCLPQVLQYRNEMLVAMTRFRLLQMYMNEGVTNDMFLSLDVEFFAKLVELWCDLVHARNRWAMTVDPEISVLVSTYTSEHIEKLTTEQFLHLTSKDYLPLIAPR